MSAPSAETKICPMCGQEIKAIARTCRFCGEYFDEHGQADGAFETGIWRDGNQLVMTADAQLPFVCIKTNQPADVWLPRKLSWCPRWVLLLLFLNPIVFVIVTALLNKQAKIEVGLCEECRAKRIRTLILVWISALLGLALFIGSLISLDHPNGPAPVFMLCGILILLVSALVGDSLPRIVQADRITEDFLWLKGVHPDYLARFPEFPGLKD
jgi:hypothetical protein